MTTTTLRRMTEALRLTTEAMRQAGPGTYSLLDEARAHLQGAIDRERTRIQALADTSAAEPRPPPSWPTSSEPAGWVGHTTTEGTSP